MIPRVVHRLWVGGPEPEWTRGFAETWRQPGWELMEWDDSTVQTLFPLANQFLYDNAHRIAPAHVGQFRSDLLRYEILHRCGGVWVDADFECLRPIDDLIADAEAFVVRVTERWLNNAIMGAVPGHPFIGALVEGLPLNVRRRRGSRPNKLSGPQYLTPIFRRVGEGVHVLDAEHFYPFLWDDLDGHEPGDFDPAERWPDAYAVHWWANQRRERVPDVVA